MTKQKEIRENHAHEACLLKPIYTTWPIMGVESPNPLGDPFVNQIRANLV
jgi:hypothetical protein